MAIPLVRFSHGKKSSWGVIVSGKVRPLSGNGGSLGEFLQHGGARQALAALHRRRSGDLSPKRIRLESPVTSPCHIVCQGKNYLGHLLEMGARPRDKDYNLFFTKAASSLTSAVGRVIRPSRVRLLDYELELGLVIGKPILRPLRISAAELGRYVAGIVMANDISARDIQIPQGQWFKGKSFRSFCPAGPHLLLLEKGEFPLLEELILELHVNDELRQRGSVRQMIYTPAETLSEISEIMDLHPGDLVLTGTPQGVAMKVPSPLRRKIGALFLSEKATMEKFVAEQLENRAFLQPGDRIRSTIRTPDGGLDLGEQRLTVVDQESPGWKSN